MTTKSAYVLESPHELERLEKQSRISAYNFKEELKHLIIPKNARILDAGCGAGNVSEYLASLSSEIHVTGWDISGNRVQALKRKYKNHPQLNFETKDILNMQSSAKQHRAPQFDIAIGRYFFQHFSKTDVQQVVRNLLSALKPGGTLWAIDIEGLFADIFPSSNRLRNNLKKIRTAPTIDLEVGRKLAGLMIDAGFSDVDVQITAHTFGGNEMELEVQNIEDRFENAGAFFRQRLGGSKKVSQFKDEYLKSIRSGVLFYNKFIVSGRKPEKATLRLVAKSAFDSGTPSAGQLPEQLEMSRYINLDLYHAVEKTHPFYLEMIEEVHRQIRMAAQGKENATLLELGAGTGLLTEELVTEHPSLSISALEYDSKIYEILKNNLEGKITCIHGDAVKFQGPVPYDILASTFMHDHIHFDLGRDFAANIRRNLKPRGRYIMGGEILPFFNTEESRIQSLYDYHLFIILKALRERHFDVAKLEIDALRSGVYRIGDFKRHEALFEEEMSKNFRLINKIKIGPADIPNVGGVFVYVFEAT